MAIRNALLIGLFLSLASCAHYLPLEMGSGESSLKQVTGCGSYILTFPLDQQAERVDVNLIKAGLSSDDIYSIERKYWPYFWPFYAESCTVLHMNKTGYEKYLAAKSTAAPELEEAKKKKPPAKKVEGEDLENFTHIKDVSECEQYASLMKGNCRKAVTSRQEE